MTDETIKYHFNKDTGRTGKCTAKIKCRLGLSMEEHFTTREEASKAYEDSMSSYSLSTLQKDVKNIENEYLAAIAVSPNKSAKEVFKDFEKMSAFLSFGNTMSSFNDVEKKFIEDFSNGGIPNEVPPRFAYDSSMLGMTVHIYCQDAGYFAKITKQFSKGLKKKMMEDLDGANPFVLDPMAGKGYFVKAMREEGVKTIGSDDKSWGNVQTDDGIENLDAVKSLKKYGNDITHLVMSWAPMDGKIDKEMYDLVKNDYPHITIVNIGEDQGGCTGSEVFWDQLEKDLSEGTVEREYDNCGYRTFQGLHDNVSFIKFK